MGNDSHEKDQVAGKQCETNLAECLVQGKLS